jgi:hypothetical protein
VRHAALAGGRDGSGDELPPGRPSLPAFAAALAFITVGAFVVGSAIRKYILAPADYGSSGGSGSPASGGGKSGRRRSSSSGSKGGQKAPSVEDLLRLHGDPLPTPPAAGAATAAPAPAAAPAGAQQQASAAAAHPPSSSNVAEPAVSSSSSLGDSTSSPAVAAAAEPEAAPAAAAAAQPVQGGQAAADWCEITLAPALAKTAGEASAAPAAEQPGPPQPPAAADAAAPAALLARAQLWMLCQATPKGPVALRLLFPVAGREQYCVALFQVSWQPASVEKWGGLM